MRLNSITLPPEQTESTITHSPIITDLPPVFDCLAIWHSLSVWLNAWPAHLRYVIATMQTAQTTCHLALTARYRQCHSHDSLGCLITACTWTSSSVWQSKLQQLYSVTLLWRYHIQLHLNTVSLTVMGLTLMTRHITPKCHYITTSYNMSTRHKPHRMKSMTSWIHATTKLRNISVAVDGWVGGW